MKVSVSTFSGGKAIVSALLVGALVATTTSKADAAVFQGRGLGLNGFPRLLRRAKRLFGWFNPPVDAASQPVKCDFSSLGIDADYCDRYVRRHEWILLPFDASLTIVASCRSPRLLQLECK